RSVQARIFLALHPAEGCAIDRRLLIHVLMADVDLAAGVANPLQTHAEALTLAAIKHLVDDRAQGGTNPAFRNLGPVLGPVGFDQTRARVLGSDRETLFMPELEQVRVDVFGGTIHNQPAQIAVALDL